MVKTISFGFGLAVFLTLAIPPSYAAEEEPMACVGEIERVCLHMEDKLETCLADRGNQLSSGCRNQLTAAMEMMEDPSGPAACIPDVQRLCPTMKARALASCMAEQQTNFSPTCKEYLQKAGSKASPE